MTDNRPTSILNKVKGNMNKTNNKSARYGITLAIAVALALPFMGAPAHATIFGPVSAQTQKANSGMILGFTGTHQNYQEFPPSGTTGLPSPLDSQTGTIPGIELGYQSQDAHIGWGVAVNVSRGNTTYNGYTENLQNGALTPATGTTSNAWGGVHGWFNYGFAPNAVHNLSFAPGVLVGIHAWSRGNSQNPGGYNEGYVNDYLALRLLTQYNIGPIVLGLTTDAGRTFKSQVDGIPGSNGPTILGNSPWIRVGLKVTYNMFSAASVFVSYSRTTFRYGQSGVNASGYVEPNSRTVNNQAEAGMDIRF